MKHLRRTLALLLCLMCTASAACAATKTSKTFTEVPTLKFTSATSSSYESGASGELEISASLPGFLTLYLLDANGNVALTIAENREIHSKANQFEFYAFDDDGNLLNPGAYTFSAEMVSQYGVASKTVTKTANVTESKDAEAALKAAAARNGVIYETTDASESAVETDSATADEDESTSSADENESDSSADKNESTSSADTSTASAKATAAPKTASVLSDEMQYTEGTYTMGDEGLLIGVGVGDTAGQTDAGYWGLTADADDAQIWAALTRTMTGVDVGESESAYIYDSPESGRKKLGTLSGISQGLNVITQRDDGWSLVEAFRNEDGAFVRGYIKSDKLRTVTPNQNYGIVIDKAAQTLTVYKDGTRLGSCKVSTGLATPKYPHRETPAGEFILVTRRGSYEYYGMGYTKYTIRFNGSYYLAEMPTTKKNGSTFLELADDLGAKATRGTVCIAHDASTDGGINAEWIWKMTDENKKVKVLIFDDKPRTDVPVSSK